MADQHPKANSKSSKQHEDIRHKDDPGLAGARIDPGKAEPERLPGRGKPDKEEGVGTVQNQKR